MDLPTMIESLFAGVQQGILVPILNGLYAITPAMVVLAVVVAVITLIFVERKGAKIASLVSIAIIAYLWQYIPDLVTALMSYGTGAVTDPAAAASAVQEAMTLPDNPSLGELQE